MAYPLPKVKIIRDNVIRVWHPELLEPSTYLTSAAAATDTALTVKNNAGFSNTDPQDNLLFEGYGNELAEIKRINGAVSAGTSLTVQALTFAHAVNTGIYKILFDQIEVKSATTATGAQTFVTFAGANTAPINITGEYTDLVVTNNANNFYFVRFYNSLATTPYYSDTAVSIASSDYTLKQVGFIKRNAFESMGETPGGIFSDQWIYDQIYLGELDVTKSLKRWSWLEDFDYDLGNVATGDRSVALPATIEDSNTNKSIYGVRIANGRNLEYISKREYEEIMEGVAFTTLSSTAAIGATTMVLTDSRDFTDSGTVNIAGTTYSYTGNTRSTNTLTGFTALSAEITSGVNVWQNITFGEPLRYTIIEGSIYWDTPPSSTYNGRNVWLDFYKNPERIDTDEDSITVNDSYLIQLWLQMQIKKKKQSGELPITDNTVVEYQARKEELIKQEESGKFLRIIPSIPWRSFKRTSSWWRQ